MLSHELLEKIAAAVSELREEFDNFSAPKRDHLYSATDGSFVQVRLTDCEAWYIDNLLYGVETADYNHQKLIDRPNLAL